MQPDDQLEEKNLHRRLRVLEHADLRAEILPPAGGSEPTGRRVCFVYDDCIRCHPELVPSSRERASKLDVVEEDRISLVEDSVVGKHDRRRRRQLADGCGTGRGFEKSSSSILYSRRRRLLPGRARRKSELALASVVAKVGKRK